jgi:hypothetical protein
MNNKTIWIILIIFLFSANSCLDYSNNFKEIKPTSLKYDSKELIVIINCGSLFELYVDEGAFGSHKDYIFESINGKTFYLSYAYLHNTGQKFVFNPVDSTIVYFKSDNQIFPTGNLRAKSYWFKKTTGMIGSVDSIVINTTEYVEKIYKLNENNQLEHYMDLEGNEFSWSFDNGIYFVGYPGVFYDKKLRLCSLE